MLRRSGIALCAFAAAWVVGCTHGPLDVERLESSHPRLAGIREHRLWDTTPYFLPTGGEIVFFLCRWPTEAPIPVSLPPDASDVERRGIESVLRAWEGAGLGVRFETGAPAGVGIEIRFIDPDDVDQRTTYAGNTLTDCALAPGVFEAAGEDVLPAELVFASIHIWRGGFDSIGRPVEYDDSVLAGNTLHEFGHALGFQGHVSVGKSVMVRETDAARRAGVARMKAQAFTDATLRALYALPSGLVVARRNVPPHQTARVDHLGAIARERGFTGPLARVGDRNGQISWLGLDRERYALRVFGVRAVLTGRKMLYVEATRASSEVLGE